MGTSYAVFCSIDVRKPEHHAVGLDASGDRLNDKALPNDEARLRTVSDRLAAYEPVLIMVDQPNTIGALPVTVTRSCGHQVANRPSLSMRRIADLYPRQARTDARDAFITTDSARTMPHTLRRVDTGDHTLTELGVLVGLDDDLASEATRVSNRIRGLLTGIHPALFDAIHDPTSRTYNDRKRAESKNHNAALICLARHRCNVLFAMLKNKTPYQPPAAQVA